MIMNYEYYILSILTIHLFMLDMHLSKLIYLTIENYFLRLEDYNLDSCSR